MKYILRKIPGLSGKLRISDKSTLLLAEIKLNKTNHFYMHFWHINVINY